MPILEVLSPLIRRELVAYFASHEWSDLLEELRRGSEVRHIHTFTKSALHPTVLARILPPYFAALGLPLTRHVDYLAVGPNTHLFYLQPPGMCHFEIFFSYSKDVVLAPLAVPDTHGVPRVNHVWDDAYMERFYSQHSFRSMDDEALAEARSFFAGPDWDEECQLMIDRDALHSHLQVRTSLHPEDLLRVGAEWIESQQWTIERAVSVVFDVHGMDRGKLTYLLAKPQVVLELEWIHDRSVLLQRTANPMVRVYTREGVAREISGVPFLELSAADIELVTAELTQSVSARSPRRLQEVAADA